MAIQIKTQEVFQEYLGKIMWKANHHAEEVVNIILPLAGLVQWKAKDFVARQYRGELANMFWCSVGKKNYCFVYNHDNRIIYLHKNNSKGEILAELNNQTTPEQIFHLFD